MEISKHFRDLQQTRWLIKENPFFWSIYRGTLSEGWRAPGCCCTRRCLEDPGRRGSREPALALGGASSLVSVAWQTAEVLINCVRNAFCEFLSSVKSSKNIFLDYARRAVKRGCAGDRSMLLWLISLLVGGKAWGLTKSPPPERESCDQMRCARQHHSPLTSQERARVLQKYCSICQRNNDNILKNWQEKYGQWVLFY